MTIGWDQLNAYVDGELVAAGRAEVATALAQDPDLAARVASLSRLKAAATQGATAHVAAAPPFVLPRPPAARSYGVDRRWAALAAALVLAIFSGAALLSRPRASAPETADLDQAAAMHAAWLDSSRTTSDTAGVQVQLGPRETVRVPDLTEAKLKLVYQSSVSGNSERPVVFLGYLGPNGCRLGFWIGRNAAGAMSSLRRASIGELTGYVWARGKYEYALVAKGMDPMRLGSFATIVASIVERDHRLDEELVVALRTSAMMGGTCAS